MKRHKLLDADQAREALAIEETLPLSSRIVRFADPSTGKETETDNDEQTRTTRRTWAKNKFVTIPAKRKGRVPGWQLLRQFLTPIPEYNPYSDEPEDQFGVLTISPNCVATLAELTEAQYEQKGGVVSGDDLQDGAEDHCLDSLRYLLGMVYNHTFPAEHLLPYAKRPPQIGA